MSSFAHPESAPNTEIDLKREAFFNHLLRIWSSIRTLRDQLVLELKNIPSHEELTAEERTTASESIGALSAVLSLANVEGALTKIEGLLAAFNHSYWTGKPEQPANQPIKSIELSKEIEEKNRKLEECLEIIEEFKALREKINQLAESIDTSFPRPNESGHAYRYHPGQKLHDSLKALYNSMKENVDMVLADIPGIVEELTDLIGAKL